MSDALLVKRTVATLVNALRVELNNALDEMKNMAEAGTAEDARVGDVWFGMSCAYDVLSDLGTEMVKNADTVVAFHNATAPKAPEDDAFPGLYL